MSKKIVDALLKQLNEADAEGEDSVTIPKQLAVQIVRLLSGQKETGGSQQDADGKILFYCADCAKSFRAEGREDKACFTKYGYHTWYAPCPKCKRQVSLNDRYWR